MSNFEAYFLKAQWFLEETVNFVKFSENFIGVFCFAITPKVEQLRPP